MIQNLNFIIELLVLQLVVEPHLGLFRKKELENQKKTFISARQRDE
jgi:hypothetical protein